MIQFYFASVLLNILGGYSLCPDVVRSRGTPFDGVRSFLRDRTTRLVVGILAAVTGAFKLLAVMSGDIPVVGDFLPAAAGMAVGATLLIDAYAEGAAKAPEAAVADGGGAELGGKDADGRGGSEAKARPGGRSRSARFLAENKGAIGIAGIIAGVLHFLFPMVMFL